MLSQDICGRFFPILHQLESGKSCCEYLNGFSGLQSIISFHLCSPPLNPFFSKRNQIICFIIYILRRYVSVEGLHEHCQILNC
ncbi:unnamed protein product [Lactuca virosa]|uniref:Uncharacterized protein n=1 Tax=Lactuca virosa TaxID=75947 RepID=A0AAU9NFJ0_9ASTR|nr:unnamed protein product [Lactuca virosa]